MPPVVRVDRDRCVAQHSLGPRGGHDHVLRLLADDRVTQTVERSVGFLVLHFFVGERRAAARTPVDDVVASIDQAFIVESDELLPHRPAQSGVQRERGPSPVRRGSDGAQLVQDDTAGLFDPLPDTLHELLAPEIPARHPLFRKLALDDVLGGDPGVVGARQPERLPALHAPPADQHVLDRVVEPVTHVKAGGHIRRWHHDHVRVPAAMGISRKEILIQPALVDLRLERSGIESRR